MKIPAIQSDIVAYLRALGRPETSRALALRFLRLERGDEETCRRLLAPFLTSVPGLAHRQGEGWSLARNGSAPADVATGAPEADVPAPYAPPSSGAASLRDFVALACEGTGPGGSGPVCRVSVLPVLAGEECQEEHFPSWAGEDDGGPPEAPGGALDRTVLEDLVQTIGDLPLVCHRVSREVEPIRRLCAEAGLPLPAPVISVSKLGHLLLGLKTGHAAIDLAAALRIETRGPDDCRGRVRIVAESYLRLLPLLLERGIDGVEALLEYQDMPAAPLDLSAYEFDADDLKGLPTGPGVYRFLDRDGQVIYVGKAKNLRARVGSYFTASARGTTKGRAILAETRALRFQQASSELEAVLLEAALISEHRPRLNRQFEVHERPAPYGPRLNLVVVLRDTPSVEMRARTCTLHLLRGGRYFGRIAEVRPASGADGSEPAGPRPPAPPESWERARRRIGRVFFPLAAPRIPAAPRGADPAADDETGLDIDWQLVSSYLRKHRDEVSFLDIDESSSREEAESRLRVLVGAVLASPGRTLAR